VSEDSRQQSSDWWRWWLADAIEVRQPYKSRWRLDENTKAKAQTKQDELIEYTRPRQFIEADGTVRNRGSYEEQEAAVDHWARNYRIVRTIVRLANEAHVRWHRSKKDGIHFGSEGRKRPSSRLSIGGLEAAANQRLQAAFKLG
jgi:hypothetical protein